MKFANRNNSCRNVHVCHPQICEWEDREYFAIAQPLKLIYILINNCHLTVHSSRFHHGGGGGGSEGS